MDDSKIPSIDDEPSYDGNDPKDIFINGSNERETVFMSPTSEVKIIFFMYDPIYYREVKNKMSKNIGNSCNRKLLYTLCGI